MTRGLARVLALLLALFVLGRASVVSAHDPFEVTTEATLLPSELTLRVTMTRATALELAKRTPSDGLFDVTFGGVSLLPIATREEPGEPTELTRVLYFRLPAVSAAQTLLTLRATHVEHLADGYTSALVLTRVAGPSTTEQVPTERVLVATKVLHPGDARLEVAVATSNQPMVPNPAERTSATNSSLSDFFLLGVEHLLTGYDHLAFLFGLLLGASSLGRLLWCITGFTLAHSLTLGASVLGWVSLPSALVELAIAASILYVGVENVVREKPAKTRAALAFAFGCVHGLGFAGALRELGLVSGSDLALALFGFNVGLEVAQLCVALLALATHALLRSRIESLPWRRIASSGVAAAGAFWLCARLA